MKQGPPKQIPAPGQEALANALRSAFRILRLLLVLVGIGYAASGIFIVDQHERAIVLLFGKAAGTGADVIAEPGLHWTLPRPFTEIIRIPAGRVQSVTTARFWHSVDEATRSARMAEGLDEVGPGYAMTGDANVLHSRWAVRYTIADPRRYAFGHEDPTRTLLAELERAVIRVSAAYPIDRAMRGDIDSLRADVEAELRRRMDEIGLALRIQGVDLLAVAPPTETASAFDSVIQAAQERDQQSNQARAEATRTLNEAKAEADRARVAAESEKERRVATVTARADAFRSLQSAWEKDPALVRETLRQDAVREALANAGRKVIVAGGKETELRMNFGSPPSAVRESTAP